MNTHTQEQLDEIVRLHGLWLNNATGGVGANLLGARLVGANLLGANLLGANLLGANLDGANLDGANLDGARLVGANLLGANLLGANLLGANLDGANLDGANLVRANLLGANLDGANLDGANLLGARLGRASGQILTIKKAMGWLGLYRYFVLAVISEEGQFIRMGCHFRSLSDWERDFWNNEDEFPDDGSAKSNMRMAAFNFAKEWLKNNS